MPSQVNCHSVIIETAAFSAVNWHYGLGLVTRGRTRCDGSAVDVCYDITVAVIVNIVNLDYIVVNYQVLLQLYFMISFDISVIYQWLNLATLKFFSVRVVYRKGLEFLSSKKVKLISSTTVSVTVFMIVINSSNRFLRIISYLKLSRFPL